MALLLHLHGGSTQFRQITGYHQFLQYSNVTLPKILSNYRTDTFETICPARLNEPKVDPVSILRIQFISSFPGVLISFESQQKKSTNYVRGTIKVIW